jgi:hypothetical protein
MSHDQYVLIGTLIGVINTWLIVRNRAHTKEDIREIHILVNSRMGSALDAANETGNATGRRELKAEQDAETAAAAHSSLNNK